MIRKIIIIACLIVLGTAPVANAAGKIDPPTGEVLFNSKTGELLYGRNDEARFSVASITKLMTALVFLDHNPGMKKKFTYRKTDDSSPAKIPLRFGEQVTVKDLFYTALVGSRNNAARALAHSTGLSEKVFVAAMNQKAKKLGMTHTIFYETTGLNEKNRSTAHDVALLAHAAFARPDIKTALATKSYTVRVLNFTKRSLTVKNTNPFVVKGDRFVGVGKTGYIDESGYNFVARSVGNGVDLVAVVFGLNRQKEAFDRARDLIRSSAGWVSASGSQK